LAELSRRPYLLRAMVEWMIDSGHTPHAIVDANMEGVEVPRAFVNDGRIVLNISPSATQGLSISADHVQFNARFSGVVHNVLVPISAVLGVYARETGEGMVFPEEGATTGPGTDPSNPGPGSGPAGPTDRPPGSPSKPGKSTRPKLKVVK
jgi:stringent starvation protein B